MTRKHFDSTILKVRKDGVTVASTYLDKGEKIAGSNVSASELETSQTQPTLTSDDSNTNTQGGEQEATPSGSGIQGVESAPETPTDKIEEDDKVSDTKNEDGSTTGTTSDENQTNETQTPTTVEQQSDSKTSTTKKSSTK